MPAERLQKVLAGRGLASRREAESWIAAGRVRVNGAVVTELGTKVDPSVDVVEVDGETLPAEQAPVVIVLHKPVGYVTTVKDPHAERTVMELLTGLERRVYPVGRLDRETRGVLILTDDGDLAHALLHPSRGVEKVYDVWVRGELPDEALTRLAEGVELRDGHVTRSARVSQVDRGEARVRFRLTLKEGHKRQVREMVRAVGGRVDDLVRVSFGGVTAEGLPEGAWRLLTPAELTRLTRAAVGVGGTAPSPVAARRPKAEKKGWAKKRTRKGVR
jgi:23S rRNA pseudouridine2605 synthase